LLRHENFVGTDVMNGTSSSVTSHCRQVRSEINLENK